MTKQIAPQDLVDALIEQRNVAFNDAALANAKFAALYRDFQKTLELEQQLCEDCRGIMKQFFEQHGYSR